MLSKILKLRCQVVYLDKDNKLNTVREKTHDEYRIGLIMHNLPNIEIILSRSYYIYWCFYPNDIQMCDIWKIKSSYLQINFHLVAYPYRVLPSIGIMQISFNFGFYIDFKHQKNNSTRSHPTMHLCNIQSFNITVSSVTHLCVISFFFKCRQQKESL